MKALEIFKTRAQEFTLLEQSIIAKASDGSKLKILEAGCGRRWPLNLGDIQYTLTGIDMDEAALQIRKTQNKDLDEIIEGDLRYIDLGDKKFDVIYNSNVLEHIENSEAVLDNFYKWLKPGGLIILRMPDRSSVFGLTTRLTPLWFHVFYYKLRGKENAGQPGFAPYPTYYDAIVSRKGIHSFCEKKSLTIKEEYGAGYYLTGQGMISAITRLYVRTVSLLSFRQLAWRHNGLTYVMEKPR